MPRNDCGLDAGAGEGGGEAGGSVERISRGEVLPPGSIEGFAGGVPAVDAATEFRSFLRGECWRGESVGGGEGTGEADRGGCGDEEPELCTALLRSPSVTSEVLRGTGGSGLVLRRELESNFS